MNIRQHKKLIIGTVAFISIVLVTLPLQMLIDSSRPNPCRSFEALFGQFKYPIVVSNYTYYIFRNQGNYTALIIGAGTYSNEAFNKSATFILRNPDLRTATGIPILHPTTYYWSHDYGVSWSYLVCP